MGQHDQEMVGWGVLSHATMLIIYIRRLTIEKTASGEIFEDESDVVISARGNLNDIAWPKIPGLDTFKGEIMHSAAWNEKYGSEQ